MFFHFSRCVPNLLFESWTVSTPARELSYSLLVLGEATSDSMLTELFGAVVFSMVLAVLYEGLKSLREYLMCVGLQSNWHQSSHRQLSKGHESGDSEDRKPLMINHSSPPDVPGTHRWGLIPCTEASV